MSYRGGGGGGGVGVNLVSSLSSDPTLSGLCYDENGEYDDLLLEENFTAYPYREPRINKTLYQVRVYMYSHSYACEIRIICCPVPLPLSAPVFRQPIYPLCSICLTVFVVIRCIVCVLG